MNINYRKIWEKINGPIPVDENGISFEIHHIDGNRTNNEISNLQCISIKEHLKIHRQQGDLSAAHAITVRMGGESSGWTHTKESIEKIKEKRSKQKMRVGWTHSDETKQKIRKSLTGRVQSKETIEKKSSSLKGKTKGYKRTEETKRKIKAARANQVFSEESNKKKSNTIKNKEKIKCPHCDIIGSVSIMKRWHFDNCKKIINNE